MWLAKRQPLSGVPELPAKSPKYGNAVVECPHFYLAPLRGAHALPV